MQREVQSHVLQGPALAAAAALPQPVLPLPRLLQSEGEEEKAASSSDEEEEEEEEAEVAEAAEAAGDPSDAHLAQAPAAESSEEEEEEQDVAGGAADVDADDDAAVCAALFKVGAWGQEGGWYGPAGQLPCACQCARPRAASLPNPAHCLLPARLRPPPPPQGLVFYLGREVPREQLLLVIRAFGGEAGWAGEGSPLQEGDERITHQARVPGVVCLSCLASAAARCGGVWGKRLGLGKDRVLRPVHHNRALALRAPCRWWTGRRRGTATCRASTCSRSGCLTAPTSVCWRAPCSMRPASRCRRT